MVCPVRAVVELTPRPRRRSVVEESAPRSQVPERVLSIEDSIASLRVPSVGGVTGTAGELAPVALNQHALEGGVGRAGHRPRTIAGPAPGPWMVNCSVRADTGAA